MDKKYQVFVSSTYEDLKLEREAVSKAILEIGDIPVGMETFSAGDEAIWKLIESQISQCDYYIVIVAHRYGSIFKDGISYTRREYEFAVECEVPVLAFVIDESVPWPPKNIDGDKRLVEFKELVCTRPVQHWKNADQLGGKVLAALKKQKEKTPRPGWVRATEEALAKVSLREKKGPDYSADLAESAGFDFCKNIQKLRETAKFVHAVSTEDASNETFIFFNVKGCCEARQCIKTFLESTNEFGAFSFVGLYDLYGRFDTLVRVEGESLRDSEAFNKALKDYLIQSGQLNSVQNSVVESSVNILKTHCVGKRAHGEKSRYLKACSDYEKFRAFKVFILISKEIFDDDDESKEKAKIIDEEFKTQFFKHIVSAVETDDILRSNVENGYNWYVHRGETDIIVEGLIACGQYYALERITRAVERFSDQLDRQKMTHLSYYHEEHAPYIADRVRDSDAPAVPESRS